ncbi:MAG TPA: pyridoxamine 5'-phosphate oxidase family protein [Isosphaeraceae bacterium]|jgi:hypothetical protein
MVIRDMDRDECLGVLAGARLARLACVKDNQPYIVPVYIAYDRSINGEPRLYGFTTEGQKVEWMRANPLVCLEVDDVTASDKWVSVVVTGRYTELSDTLADEGGWIRPPEVALVDGDKGRMTRDRRDERLQAYKVLKARAVWWQPGSSAHVRAGHSERLTPIYYRVSIDQITGHRAIPDPRAVLPPDAPAGDEGWLHRLLHFVRRPL